MSWKIISQEKKFKNNLQYCFLIFTIYRCKFVEKGFSRLILWLILFTTIDLGGEREGKKKMNLRVEMYTLEKHEKK
jgi:hypothetical protein